MKSFYLTANGIRFHILGDGPEEEPLVLLLHGFPEFSYAWHRQLPVLAAAGYRAWAPDLRGYNLSDKPRGVRNYHLLTLARDVRELIRAAGVERAVVIGHDWGAIIAWRFAMEYPQALSKLVILNVPHPGKYAAGVHNPRQLMRSWYIGLFQIPWLPEYLLSHNSRSWAEELRRAMIRQDRFTEADAEAYARAMAQPGAMRAAVDYYRAFARWGFWLPVKLIHAPTLMIWGENDVALEKSLTYNTEKFVSNFRVHYIPHCGHWVQNEAPEEVNKTLLEFLQG